MSMTLKNLQQYQQNMMGAKDLFARLRAQFTTAQAEEIESFLHAGDPKLALEFTVDAIVENDTPLTVATFKLAEELSRAMDSDRSIDYIRKLINAPGE
jgi:hypothetical protein